MIAQTTLTRIFLKQWDKSIDEANIKFYARQWWSSIRHNQSSLRLTAVGLDFLVNVLKIKAYEIPFTEPIEKSPQTVVFLSRYINCPYYLTNYGITVFSEIKSFELLLFSDDIRKYGIIKSLKDRRKALEHTN